MIEHDTIELLRECDAGIQMGIAAIDEVKEHAENFGFKTMLEAYGREYARLQNEIQGILHTYRDEGKDPNPIAKGMSWLKTNFELAVKGAIANGVLLELNASSLDPENARKNGPENDRLLLKTCEKYGAPILLGSDAHFDDMIGNFGTACSLLEELEFPEALVMNGQPEKLKTYLNRWRNKTS